jgi:lysophospholipase L1-like esterase
MMTQFKQKNNNTNIIFVNIPQTHDLAKYSRTNLEIQTFNTKLNKTATLFSHVTLIEIDFNRKYYTKHGLHLNNAGKEWLAKLIASQIDRLVTSTKLNPQLPLIGRKRQLM